MQIQIPINKTPDIQSKAHLLEFRCEILGAIRTLTAVVETIVQNEFKIGEGRYVDSSALIKCLVKEVEDLAAATAGQDQLLAAKNIIAQSPEP